MLYIFDVDGTLIEGFMETNPCPACEGRGVTEEDRPLREARCPVCKGRGYDPGDPLPYERVVALPRRKAKLAHLARERDSRFALATNQSGVAFGYQTPEEVYTKLGVITAEFKAFHLRPVSIHYCFTHPRASELGYAVDSSRRKPKPGMLQEALLAHYGTTVIGSEAIYVGDMPTDQRAAKAARIPYVDAGDFFE